VVAVVVDMLAQILAVKVELVQVAIHHHGLEQEEEDKEHQETQDKM